eukprot:2991042-Lingulodinium_polyedra.AAC.1
MKRCCPWLAAADLPLFGDRDKCHNGTGIRALEDGDDRFKTSNNQDCGMETRGNGDFAPNSPTAWTAGLGRWNAPCLAQNEYNA